MSVTLKQCRTCKQEKPTTEFSKRKLSKDGLQYDCKYCYNVKQNAQYAHKKALKHIQGSSAEWVGQLVDTLTERQQGHCYVCGSKRPLIPFELHPGRVPGWAVCAPCFQWLGELKRLGSKGFTVIKDTAEVWWPEVKTKTTPADEPDPYGIDSLMASIEKDT